MRKMKILLVFVVTLFMTGCVKMNATMKINKDKSMDYEIIMAVDESLMQGSDSTLIDEKDVEEAKNNGFTIEEYTEDSMKGYKMTKHIKNIDSVSSKDSIESSIDVDNENKYLFTIKKGFFKNTYTAKLTTNSTDDLNSYMSDDNTSLDDDDDWSWNDDSDDDDWSWNDDSDDEKDDTDYSQYLSYFDMKFEVNLPYKAKSNNASDVTNGGKKLTWNLTELTDGKAIEFEFAIYNIGNIAIVGGIALAIIILAIVMILKNKKKTSNNVNGQTTQVQPQPTTVQQPVPTPSVEQPTTVQQQVEQPMVQSQPEPIQNNPYVQQNIVSEQTVNQQPNIFSQDFNNSPVETNNEQTNNIQN